ncbi:coenzyme Q-binding protein COQ10 homolog B, mitochondrial isoform X2 [Vigna umbellata]|uniref:coenzyme Q-binding protein COQ10 homolog B, mitochondrial isoform X2 n=1 Tax=Vigna umbellata TaxID=87088 RepID=UPI001F5F10DC|nr:coenzyme Q-binding protein COQ10 homolog B, mitochondrial isoform X2 [Vigna umbellata]
MPPFLSTSKALCSLASRKSGASQLIRSSTGRSITAITGHHIQPSVSRIGFSSIIGGSSNSNNNNNYNAVHTRQFLGCGDGEEGILSKTYEERRVLGYSPEQLFDVVAAVEFYHGFVPWCQRSDIIRHHPDGSFDAELEIGFKFLVESYVSHVQVDRPKRIKIASMFFKEVASKMVGSFTERCRLIYGPEVQVHENPYGKRA